MDRTVIVQGKQFPIQYEHEGSYELMEFAPDGEEVRYIVSKADCRMGRDGRLYADLFEVDAEY
ncbi:hypothetical protein PM3016_4442 [Paenibacillus mucilaginosus 3016]|uniref:Uncharacterized protein n=2 Tax=Paenibacillus mucilaginosus TaxID=61624 RepID=H6NQ15_9BACL|nr:hypothetical protein [Paenibacillus mucilaginosus]AFC31206.1 hypothetical protein PM3016_4442 [Paenibacillus mucilaginosus 3016]AFH63525.1 hypothetical protein B2K_22985 [Paenibacillus mucilaginosus K02]WFA19775.1 hypothetical protein ERY13_22305 [Paenibacillus mucilaginosus]